MRAAFIVGCGDIGKRVASLWQKGGGEVRALARSTASADVLAGMGIMPVRGDLDNPGSLRDLPVEGAVVFYFAPPPPAGTTDPRMAAFVAALGAQRPERLVCISTSGVYGDHGGAWVSETTPPSPGTDRSRRRLDAENVVRAWGREHFVPVVIMRVGGIYGPGRWPLDRLRAGEPVVREEECGFTNRIHQDDLAVVCVAAAERGRADHIYNVSDGRPGTMTEYFFAVADHFRIPRPPTVSLADAERRLSPAMMSYLKESRRMDNSRMMRDLGVTLRYANLESALGAVDRKETFE